MDSWVTWYEAGGVVMAGGALWGLRWAVADFVLDRFGDVWTDRLHRGQRAAASDRRSD